MEDRRLDGEEEDQIECTTGDAFVDVVLTRSMEIGIEVGKNGLVLLSEGCRSGIRVSCCGSILDDEDVESWRSGIRVSCCGSLFEDEDMEN